MEVLKGNLDRVRVPGAQSKVFKDECLYSFDSPESKTGLYVCLNRFIGVGDRFLEKYSKRTDNRVFLHIKRTKKEVEDKEVPEKVSRLAINMEGGFNTDSKDCWEENSRIVIFPSMEVIELNNSDLPLQANLAAAGVLTAVSATRQAQVDAATGSWDGEVLVVSKHAENLPQNPNPPIIPATGWKCQLCDLTTNLWLNLTDGSILCGRRNFDGSGGNNHAVEHYQNGKGGGPLAVKLGTITKDGKADVFSYDEDDMVLDPFLEKHLAHFGIKTGALEKTDKSMIELQIEMNERIGEWAVLTESGTKLQPMWGPGKTGLHNLGNTCYMNSVLQVIFSLPEFRDTYLKPIFYDRCDLNEPDLDLKLQMCKLCQGMVTGDYSRGTDEVEENVLRDEGSVPGIKPLMFKNLIGKGDPEFSSNRQQDAQEFFMFLMTHLERTHRNHEVPSPSNIFKFCVEDRTECAGQVRYKSRTEFFLPFNVPLEAATNHAEVEAYCARKSVAEAKGEKLEEEEVRHKIPFSSLFQSFMGESIVDDFYSPALGQKTQAKQTARLKTFPDYLLVSLSKYQMDENHQPVKLNVEIDMPEDLDLSTLKSSGLQPSEILMPEEELEKVEVFVNDEVVAQLSEMGFSREGCKRAVHETKNSGVDAAMAWVMEHMGDPDFNEPFIIPGQKKKKDIAISEDNIAMVMSMGFEAEMAKTALRNTDNNVERAIEWIFSHPEGETMSGSDRASGDNGEDSINGLTDGNPRYVLTGFISHMGKSPQSGHYVCHIKDEKLGRWIIFNDNKVAISEKPPKEFGYLYMYRRA